MIGDSWCYAAGVLRYASLFGLAKLAAADDWSAEFIFPVQTGYVMHNMDIMEVSYKSNYPNASLWAFCYNGAVTNDNLVIMGVFKQAQPLSGSETFQFDNGFSSEFCWYNLRNLNNEEKGINGVRFSYDWKTRSSVSTLKSGSKPEITEVPSSSSTAPASTSATTTAQSSAQTSAPAGSSTGGSAPPESSGAKPSSAGQGPDGSTSAPSSGSGTSAQNPTGTAGQPTGSNTPPTTGSNTQGQPGSHTQTTTQLGTGVIAGIVVGAVLGVLGIFGFLGALWVVKRRKKSATEAKETNDQKFAPDNYYVDCGRAEVDGKSAPQELYGGQRELVELPT